MHKERVPSWYISVHILFSFPFSEPCRFDFSNERDGLLSLKHYTSSHFLVVQVLGLHFNNLFTLLALIKLQPSFSKTFS